MENNMYTSNGKLFISVKNISEFKELIEKAKEQNKNLQDTMKCLENFEINIEFENKKET